MLFYGALRQVRSRVESFDSCLARYVLKAERTVSTGAFNEFALL